jgi:hypothetical protein
MILAANLARSASGPRTGVHVVGLNWRALLLAGCWVWIMGTVRSLPEGSVFFKAHKYAKAQLPYKDFPVTKKG